MELSIIQIILYCFPESLLLTYVGLGLNGIKISKKNYIQISILLIISLIILRNLFNLYGFHTFILCIILIILMKLFINISWKEAAISSLSGFIILLLGENLLLPLLKKCFGFNTINEIFKNNQLYFIIAYLTKLPLLLAAWAIYYFDFILFNLESE